MQWTSIREQWARAACPPVQLHCRASLLASCRPCTLERAATPAACHTRWRCGHGPRAIAVSTPAAASAAGVPQDKPLRYKPAFNKYRSRADIEQDYINDFRRITMRDESERKPVTPLSMLLFVPVWLKYNAIPLELRFVWYVVWSALKSVEFRWHRFMVLQGARLDSWLAGKGSRGRACSFSRRAVLQRYHRQASWTDTLAYRWALLRGAATQPPAADAAATALGQAGAAGV